MAETKSGLLVLEGAEIGLVKIPLECLAGTVAILSFNVSQRYSGPLPVWASI